MSTAIIYYSKKHNTKRIAEMTAAAIEAVKFQLEPTGGFGFCKTIMNKTSKLKNDYISESAPHDTLVLLTPVWASKSTTAINSYLQLMDFKGKTVYVATTQADPNGKDSDKIHASISEIVKSKGGKVAKCIALTGGKGLGKYAGEEALQAEADKLVALL